MAKINTVFSFTDNVSSGMNNVRQSVENVNSTMLRLNDNINGKVNPTLNSMNQQMNENAGGIDRMGSGLLDLNATMQIIGSLKNAFDQLSQSINECVSTYQYQAEQELKLETIMRQRMNATDDEIQSIKNFASAQQQIGVYGDEIILQGAQELASFVSNKKAIETLIPAMNNLIAQQYGYSASGQQFQSTADMMGKVLSGQTGALSRMGYIFSEEEKQLLKTGDEMQRASVLAKIITDNVGEMNVALRNTDMGAMQDMSNTIGDLKENLGKALIPFQSMFKLATGKWEMVFLETLTNGLNFINSHPLVSAILKGVVAGALTAIAGVIIGSVIPAIGGLVAELTVVKTVLTAMSGPVGWIIAGVGLLVGGTIALGTAIASANKNVEKVDETSKNWAEDISEITTDVGTMSEAINNPDAFRFSTEGLDAFRYNLHNIGDELDYIMLNQKGLDIDWRTTDAKTLNRILSDNANIEIEEVQHIMYLKNEYDQYLQMAHSTVGAITSQNILLEQQQQLANMINASRERSASIENDIADAYARTAQGQRELTQAKLAEYKALREAGGTTTVEKIQGVYDPNARQYKFNAFSGEQMNQLDAIISEMEQSLKPKSTGYARTPTTRIKTDSSGALIVSDKNLVDISNDYRELLSKRATEKYNLQYKSVTPSININNMEVKETADVDNILNAFSTKLRETAESSLTSVFRSAG